MRRDIIDMCREISELTLRNCVARGGCRGDGSKMGACCERAHCDLAKQTANRCGIEVVLSDDGSLPIVDGACSIPPHLRFICAVHQCDIASVAAFGSLPPEDTQRYFELRERISEMMSEEL